MRVVAALLGVWCLAAAPDLKQFDVVEFFATWCAVCRQEVIAVADTKCRTAWVSIDSEREPVERWIEALPKPARVRASWFHDPDAKFAQQHGIEALPLTLLVRDGKPVERLTIFDEKILAKIKQHCGG